MRHQFTPKTMPTEARRLFSRAFPEYRGKKFTMQASDTVNMASYWDGGSRDFFVVLRADGASLTVPQQSAFDRPVAGASDFQIPEGFVVVEHSIFRGKDMGLTLHVPRHRFQAMLPATTITLTPAQHTVLRVTAHYKSSYRRTEAAREGISDILWAVTQRELQEMGLLRKNGSITPEGRNHV